MSFSGVPWSQTWGMLFVASFLVIEIFTSIAHDAIHGNQPPPVNNTVRSRNLMVIKQGRFKTGPVLESILRSVYFSLFMVSLPEVFLSERRDLLRRVYRLCDKPTTMPAVVFGITALPSSRPLDVGRWKCMGDDKCGDQSEIYPLHASNRQRNYSLGFSDRHFGTDGGNFAYVGNLNTPRFSQMPSRNSRNSTSTTAQWVCLSQ